MRRRRRERPKPMPTEEEKRKAQLKAASADPLVWAMKSVDDKFPDERIKSEDVIRAEAEVEREMDEMPDDEMLDDDDVLDDIDDEPVTEIRAEGKTAMPMSDGVMTVDVAPMRQNVDNVSGKEVNRIVGRKTEIEKAEAEKAKKAMAKKTVNEESANKKPQEHRNQIKLDALESKQKKMVFAIVALVIVAIGGVLFGVVTMMRQGQKAADTEAQVVTYGSGSGGEDNTADGSYIYLKDWGMKIKIVSGLGHISFDYDEDEYSQVLIWGARKDSGANYTPDFAKQSKNGTAMGIVTRVPRYERAAAGRLIWYDDYYNYYYQGPSSEPEASEAEMSWWVESYLLIKEMLTNADNYIKFDETTVGQQ